MAENSYVYVSSWDHFGGEKGIGIGLYEFDPQTGQMIFKKMVDERLSCNVSIVDKKRNLLYVNNEVEDLAGTGGIGGGGRVCVYRIDPEDGTLTPFTESPSYGSNPCMLSQDSTGNYLVLANHAAGEACVTKISRDIYGKYSIQRVFDDSGIVLFPLDKEGRIGDPLDIVVQNNPRCGTAGSHLHTVTMSPDGNLIAVCDKGWNRIHMYCIDREHGTFKELSVTEEAPDANIRYAVFHDTLPYMYVNHEVANLSITVYKYDRETGQLTFVQSADSVDEGTRLTEYDEGQGLRMHPSGKYLYNGIANKIGTAPQQIAVFEIDQESGALRRIQNRIIEGRWLRSHTISPDGRFLVTTCIKSGDIEVFSIGSDGKLSPAGYRNKQEGAAWSTFYGE